MIAATLRRSYRVLLPGTAKPGDGRLQKKLKALAEFGDSAFGIEDLATRLRFEFTEGNIWLGEERMVLLHM